MNKKSFYSIVGRVISFICDTKNPDTKNSNSKSVAEFLSVSEGKLKKYETGEEEIPLYEFFRLCKAYNFPFFISQDLLEKYDDDKLLDLYNGFLSTKDKTKT